MELDVARGLAAQVVAWLAPSCSRIEVAGSVRRGSAHVRDLEVVAIPRPMKPLFGQPASPDMAIVHAMLELTVSRDLQFDVGLKRNGSRYKRLWLPRYGVAVDLFLAEPRNWGNILAIRTGDAEFARQLVTRRDQGGLMPEGLRQHDGFLWHETDTGERVVPCREEDEFFAALGIAAPPPPARRNYETAWELRIRQRGATVTAGTP